MSKFRVYLLKNDHIAWGERIDARSAHRAAARARERWAGRLQPGSLWTIEVWNGAERLLEDDFHLGADPSFAHWPAMQPWMAAPTSHAVRP